jgi:hypothetical protein
MLLTTFLCFWCPFKIQAGNVSIRHYSADFLSTMFVVPPFPRVKKTAFFRLWDPCYLSLSQSRFPNWLVAGAVWSKGDAVIVRQIVVLCGEAWCSKKALDQEGQHRQYQSPPLETVPYTSSVYPISSSRAFFRNHGPLILGVFQWPFSMTPLH